MFLDRLFPEPAELNIKEAYGMGPSPERLQARRRQSIAKWAEKFALLAALATQVDTCQRNLFPEVVDVVDVVDITRDGEGNLDYQFGASARDE